MRVVTQVMSLSPLLRQRSQKNYSALPKPRLRIHFGFLYYLREARLRYLFSNASNLGIAQEAAKSLLHELRFRFLSTLVFLWLCQVFEFDDDDKVDFAFCSALKNDEIWISRQAVLGGFKPRYLNETIDYDFLRNVLQVKIRVWATSYSKRMVKKNSKPPFSQTIWLNEQSRSGTRNSEPQLVMVDDAEIHHGKCITIGSRLFPISFEQYNPSFSWPTDSFVKSESSFYIMQSERKIHISEAIFIGESSGWYHFIVEFLPRYLSIPDQMRSMPTIIAGNTNERFRELLEILGFRNLILTDLMEKIEVHRLLTIKDFRFEDPFDFSARQTDLLNLQNVFRNIKVPKKVPFFHERILIHRPENTFRRMENSEHVVRILKEFGFKVIYPETFSFTEQLSIFRSAKIVVGQSGAALTSLIFCNKGTKCFELGNWEKSEEQFFWRDFANQINLSITPIYSQPKSLLQKFEGTFKSDVSSLISALGC